MKKLFIACIAVLIGSTSASAQEWWDDIDRGIFNHVGANLSVGTEGISLGVAAPITEYLELGIGANYLPGIKVKGDVNICAIATGIPGYTIPSSQVKLTGNFARTTFDAKLNVYPFGDGFPLFIAGGISFGGEKIAKLTGHSDEIKSAISLYPQLEDLIYAEIDKYNIKFDKNGDVNGDIRVNKIRPYVGLGFGRLVPKNRVSFRFEMGCQFMGKMKVYQNDEVVDISDLNDTDDDLSKIVDKLKVYPVLKFTLTGRIF